MGTTDPATLIDSQVMAPLAARIVKEHGDIDLATARRIIGPFG
ncbi:hypothetical protein [Streptomyces sp. NPDC048332]